MEYTKCLVEVDEILRHLKEEDLEKVPVDILEAIKESKDKEYTFKYDETKSLKEQDISRDTIAILSYINTEYLLSENQRKIMEEFHKLNDIKKESDKIGNDNVFKTKDESPVEKVAPLAEVKELKWYEKILNFFKSLFK